MGQMGYRDAAAQETDDEPTSEVPSALEAVHLRALFEPALSSIQTCAVLASALAILVFTWLALFMLSAGATAWSIRIAAACGAVLLLSFAAWHGSEWSLARISHDRLVSMWGDLELRPSGWVFIADDGPTFDASVLGAYVTPSRTRARVNTRLRVALPVPLLSPALPTVPMRRASIDASLAEFRASFHGR
jgi:hypothetical protein